MRRIALALAVLVALALLARFSLSSGEQDDLVTPAAAPGAAAAATNDEPPSLPSPSERLAPREELTAAAAPAPAAALAPRTGRIEAVVRDEQGAPVAGYALRAVAGAASSGSSVDAAILEAMGYVAGPPRRVQTDAAGRAIWEDLEPGTWTVAVDESLRIEGVGVQPTWVNAEFAIVGEPEASLEVTAGSTARHVFEVAHEAHVVVRLDQIPNESELEELSLDDREHHEARRLHSVIEHTEGATQVEWSVAPGEWVLSARWAAGSWCWSRPELLELQPGERREATVTSLPAQVTWGGRVVDTEGRPVGGVVLAVSVREPVPSRGGSGRPGPLGLLAEKRVSSADDGSWSLAVPAGATALEVDTENGRGRYLAVYDVEPKLGAPSQPIEIVVASACILDAAVTLPPAPPSATEDIADDSTWTLAIRRQIGPSTWSGQRRATREGGRFTLKRLAAGRYQAELSFGETVCARALQFEVAPGFGEGDRIRVALDFSR